MHTLRATLLLTSALSLSLLACSTDDDTPAPQPLTATTVKDVGVEPATGKYTFYSLRTNGVVPNSDSATTKWDLGLRGTIILTNGGSSGPGQGGASVQSGIFSEIKSVPTGATFAQDSKTALAIPTGSDRGWYNYNSSTNVISPLAGKVLLIKTAEGKYAKLEILSYYKGAPAQPTAASEARYYTFRYVYQPDGSTKLE